MTARHRFRFVAALTAAVLAAGVTPAGVAHSEDYQRISGEGSSWAANAISDMQYAVQQYGMRVDYSATGSTAGRQSFLNGTVDFAASDIPFQFHPEDTSSPENPAPGSYAYIPVVAGGTAFMYNLKINGQRVTNLRLSGENVAKIFAGDITMWNDPALQADNPGLVLPARTIVPVVRSDGSGSTAQFTMWMINRHPAIWSAYCQQAGREPDKCGFTSFYPTIPGMIAQSGDSGVAQYVSQSFAEGAIGYVNYSYAKSLGFPVAKVLNAAGYYTEPTPKNVAVSLLQADINTDESNPAVYLTQNLDRVYTDTDPRNYQLSSYSYFILPTSVRGQFNEAKGKTVAAFAKYAMCEAQQASEGLGYSPMPINLVQASFDQIRKIPGADVGNVKVEDCNNPTFSKDGHNVLVDEAPMPPACDQQGIPTQCEFGTVGLENTTVSGGGSSYGTGGGGGGGGGGDQGGGQDPQGGDPGGGGQAPQGGGDQGAGDPGSGDPGSGDAGGSDQGGGGQGGGNAPATPTSAPCASTTTPSPSTSIADSSTSSTAPTTPDPCATTVAPPTTAPSGSAAPAGEVACDPDTGVCGGPVTAALVSRDGEAAVARDAGPVRASTLDGDSGWGVAQTLMVIVVLLLTVAIIVVPSVVWRRLAVERAS